MVSLRLRGNGNLNDNYGFSSSSYGNIGIGNRHHYSSSRSNPVNLVDRGGDNSMSSSISSSTTTVCNNCLGSMSYDSTRDIWYCPKCRHNSNNNKIATTSTSTTNFRGDNGGSGSNDKPVMTGGRTQSDNAEQDDTTEHIFAVGHSQTREERKQQKLHDKEFGNYSDIKDYLKKSNATLISNKEYLPKGDWETFSADELRREERMKVRSVNTASNTWYSWH